MPVSKLSILTFALILLVSCGSSSTSEEASKSNEPMYVTVKAGLVLAKEENPRIPGNNCRDSLCVRYRVMSNEDVIEHLDSWPEDSVWATEATKIEWWYSFDACDDDGKYRRNPTQRITSTKSQVFGVITALPHPEQTWDACLYLVEMQD